MAKTIKAPKTFLEDMKRAMDVINEAGDIIGVSFEWLEQRQSKPLPKDKIERLNRGQKEKLWTLLDIGNTYQQYAWKRFKHENIDNEWGRAERLYYDKDKARIEIKRGINSFMKESLDKFLKEFPSMKGMLGKLR